MTFKAGLKIIFSRQLLILIFFMPSLSDLHSQNFTSRTFTTADGITHNNVRQMITDSSGFLWISTWDGLNRYDGYEFKQYHHLPGDTSSFPFFSLNDITIDANNCLWVLADNGKVARYNPENDDFIVINRIDGVPVPLVYNINTDEAGDLWMVSKRNIYRYSAGMRKFDTYSVVFPEAGDSLISGSPYNMKWISPEKVWITGLITYGMQFDEDNHKFIAREIYTVESEMLPDKIVLRGSDHYVWYKMIISDNGSLWLYSNEGLFRLNNRKRSFEKFHGEFPVGDFTKSGEICWGNLNREIFVFRPGTGKVNNLSSEKSGFLRSYYLKGDMLWYSLTTPNGNPGGMNRIIFTPDYFTSYHPDSYGEMLPAIYALTLDRDNNLWLGARGYDYLLVYGKNGDVRKINISMPEGPQYYGAPRSMIATPDGIWIGFFYGKLLFYDYNKATFINHETGQEFFRAVAPLNDTSIIIGQYDLKRYNPETGACKLIYDSFGGRGVFRLTKDSEGIVWGAMSSSAYFRYIPAKEETVVYKLGTDSYNVEDVLPVSESEVWFTLLGGGLVRHNPELNESKVYTTSSGLANNTTYSVLRDSDGNIWVSTDMGISRLNPATGIIKNFGVTEGVSIVEFNSGASLAGSDGRFYFGGMGGAVSFFPDSINRSEKKSSDQRILLTQFTVSGRFKNLNGDLNKIDTIELAAGENNFQVGFASTDFVNSPKALYRYMMVQKEGEWIAAGPGNRNVSYANLRPGYSTLLIQASDRNGEWAASRKITIHLHPFFYQTLIFKIVLIILLFGIFHLIISLYIRQMRQKSRQIQYELRLQSLRGQMNPHFIFNSLNSINYFISRNDKISANRYISDFSRLIRSILSNMGNDYVQLEKEISSIRDYLEIEHLRFGDKFDYEIVMEVNQQHERAEVYPGLIQPFIENAIWHGIRALENRKGFIRVRIISDGDEKLQCIIEDDGVGRKASSVINRENSNHKSRGISIVTERLNIFSKLKGRTYSLEIADMHPDREETGTVVRIDIPFRII